ncbi:MAG: hypothetical protein AAF761_01640 [Pseudomonadota bacterium]
MLLNRTIAQLDIGYVPPDRAEALGHLGYLQWLGAVSGSGSYRAAAERALTRARPFCATSPAVVVFCALLERSSAAPLDPLVLRLPERTRRGGARARRDPL